MTSTIGTFQESKHNETEHKVRKPKTGEDFKHQAKVKSITNWFCHNCSICGYPCTYLFENENDVYYNPGCYCLRMSKTRRTWNDIAEHYNIQDNAQVIEEMNEYWGFE